MRALVVEDDTRISADIVQCLEAAGFSTSLSETGEEAWFRGDTEDFDAIVLDLGLPDLDGLTILKRWRANERKTPVLILTARGTWSERVEGIDAGADDYLPKPFHMEELLARLRAIIRRSAGQASSSIIQGDVKLDTKMMQVFVRGRPISLSRTEYRLISYALHHRGSVLSQAKLADHIYGEEVDRDSNVIEVLVGRVRRKLGADIIQTKRGYGYFVPNPQE